MKRRQLTAALGAVTLLAAFTATYYVFYLKQQTAALLAARKSPEAAERYARIREAIKPPAGTPEPAAQEWPPIVFEGDREQSELLRPLNDAGAVFSRLEGDAAFQEEWRLLYGDLFGDRGVSTWSAADWERLDAFLAKHGDLLAEIRAMAAESGPLYPLDLSQGYATLLPHLAPTRELARLLQAEAIALGRKGDFEGAAADILAGLQLGARIREEPLLISQLVSAQINGILYDGVASAFPEGQIPSELAAEIARYAHATSSSDSMAECMLTEHNFGLDFMSQIMDSSWGQGDVLLEQVQLGRQTGTWGTYLYASPLARPWQNLDAQAYGRIMSEFETTLGLPYFEAKPVLDALAREVEDLPATRMFTRSNLPSLFSFHRELARDQARQQIVLLGAALETYANEYGTYPPNLDAVRGQSNGASVIDPFTGTPFHYNPTGNGFELYSVGRDLEDDGGRHDLRDGDIAWRGEEAPAPARSNLVARG